MNYTLSEAIFVTAFMFTPVIAFVSCVMMVIGVKELPGKIVIGLVAFFFGLLSIAAAIETHTIWSDYFEPSREEAMLDYARNGPLFPKTYTYDGTFTSKPCTLSVDQTVFYCGEYVR